jgi:hypothetical protein
VEPGNIIYTPISDIHDAELKGFIDHWRTLPKTDGFPDHADIDLRRIRRGLPHVHAYDVIGPSTFRVRLLGTAMTRLAGGEFTGHVLEVTSKDPRESRTAGILHEVFIAKQPILTNVYGGVIDGAHFVHLESLWLPFRGEDGAFSRIVAMSAESLLVEFQDVASPAG